MKDKKIISHIFLIVIDMICIIISLYGSLFLRFNGTIDVEFLKHLNKVVIVLAVLGIIVFALCQLYQRSWKTSFVVEVKNVVVSAALSSIVNILICEITRFYLPRSCYFIYFMLLVMLSGGIRYICKLYEIYGWKHLFHHQPGMRLDNVYQEKELLDMFDRDEVTVNEEEIKSYIQDKIILITGAGGKMGQELCRQVADYHPKLLIIVDKRVEKIYDLQLELKQKYPHLPIVAKIESICEQQKVEQIFKSYYPHIIFHAAYDRYIQNDSYEYIRNNIMGTFHMIHFADQYQAERLIFLSSHKAIYPINMLAATQRIGEMLIQTYNKTSKTQMKAIRFGSELGLKQSEIMHITSQMKEGGSVMVNPEAKKYLITISEAVKLILQAGAYPDKGIYALEVGYPMKMEDIVRKLISLFGYQPDIDIKIDRLKLDVNEDDYQEKPMKQEMMTKTHHPMIYMAPPIEMNEETFIQQFDNLQKELSKESQDLRVFIGEMVPVYQYLKAIKKKNVN